MSWTGIIGGLRLRAPPLLAVLLAAALSAGCSTLRLAYDQGPRLAYWWLDPYVDFNGAQEQHARQEIEQWFQWHRRTQLPVYAQALNRAQGQAAQDTHAAQACQWWDEVQRWRDAAFEHALPKAAELALALTPAQVDHLQQHYTKINRKFRDEYLPDDPETRRRKTAERAIDRAERFYGRLDDAQRRWVAEQIAAGPFDPELWQRERLRRQQDIVQTLRALHERRATPEQAREAIRAVYQRTVHSPDEAYRQHARALTAYNCEFAAQLHNRTSAQQRRTAAERLRGWENDLRALAEADTRVGAAEARADSRVSALER